MSYKTILLHVDDSKCLAKRVEVAAKMALYENAHLIGVAATGTTQLPHLPVVVHADNNERAFRKEEEQTYMLRHGANAALQQFETLVREIGVTSYETHLMDDDVASAVSRYGRYADLIILGQSDIDDPSLTAKVDFPEYVVLNSECPVLIIPYVRRVFSIGERILIAWNGSMAASRAVRNALPLLRQARTVQIAIIDSEAHPALLPAESSDKIVAYLARHHITGEVVRRTNDANAGQTLLTLAADLTSDLIVMGCVAHPRGRHKLLGGATRVVLESATLPILMSH